MIWLLSTTMTLRHPPSSTRNHLISFAFEDVEDICTQVSVNLFFPLVLWWFVNFGWLLSTTVTLCHSPPSLTRNIFQACLEGLSTVERPICTLLLSRFMDPAARLAGYYWVTFDLVRFWGSLRIFGFRWTFSSHWFFGGLLLLILLWFLALCWKVVAVVFCAETGDADAA